MRRPRILLVAYLCLLAAVSERGIHSALQELEQLGAEHKQMQRQLVVAQAVHAQLGAHLRSSSAPEWIEQALMRQLGLVPEGYQKVIFD